MAEPAVRPSDKPATPTWVKVFGAMAVIFVVGFAVLHLAGGGFGSHMHSAP